MDAMKEAIKEAMLKVQGAVEELQEVLSGEEKEEIITGKEESSETEEQKPKDMAPELKGKTEAKADGEIPKEMVESSMGLDMPHQSKESFAMKLKSKMGNKA